MNTAIQSQMRTDSRTIKARSRGPAEFLMLK